MAFIRYNDIGITAIAACVPSKVVSNYQLNDLMSDDNISRLIKSTGIEERRVTEQGVTASDLCFKAAVKLIEDNNIDRNSIDLLLFSTISHDYYLPQTGPILQHRLGLPHSTACIDMVYACTSFIYALSTAYAYVSSLGIKRALVLVGETMSKVSNPRDKVNYPLYGDAGTAFLVEKGAFGESIFQLNSDGSGAKYVITPCRGFRNPLTVDSLLDKEYEEGNVRRDIDVTMDGMETFNHAIFSIPKQVKGLMQEAKISSEDIDFLVSHQANKLMVEYIVKKVKIDISKVPFCLHKYGNTSGASIPLTIVSELADKLKGEKKLFFSAIGAGWSYGTAYIKTNNLKVSPIIDY